MTVIAPKPFTFRDMTFKVGSDNYEAGVSKVELVPTTSTVIFKGAAPGATFTDVTEASWVANVEYAQDWETPGSLSNYLHEHAGETVEVEFVPRRGVDQPSVTATVVLVPGSIGGTVDQTAKGSVSLGVQGKPVITPAA